MTATYSFVKETFDRFNTLCFDGVLPPVPIVLVKARTFVGKMEYKQVRGLFGLISSNKDFRMRISTSFDLPVTELEDVVIHEMIHYYISWKNIRDTSAHGEVFRNIMEQINVGHGRHITVRHHSSEGQMPVRSEKISKHYVCVSTFRDGLVGITVSAETRIFELHRYFTRCSDIVKLEWYGTLDPFFDRYPRSKTPKVYKIAPDELSKHLEYAQRFSCDGHSLIPIT